jgi:hypothetical protein
MLSFYPQALSLFSQWTKRELQYLSPWSCGVKGRISVCDRSRGNLPKSLTKTTARKPKTNGGDQKDWAQNPTENRFDPSASASPKDSRRGDDGQEPSMGSE